MAGLLATMRCPTDALTTMVYGRVCWCTDERVPTQLVITRRNNIRHKGQSRFRLISSEQGILSLETYAEGQTDSGKVQVLSIAILSINFDDDVNRCLRGHDNLF